MKTLTYITQDKTTWGEGPWQDEPDKIQYEDEVTGLPCLIKRNRVGALCGYVGVSEGHPLFGVEYQKAPSDLEVHGWLTYSSFCQEGGDEAHTICHVPGQGEPDRVWWLGFDCAHGDDLCPGLEALLGSLSDTALGRDWMTYKTVEYVRAECTSLAKQLMALQE